MRLAGLRIGSNNRSLNQAGSHGKSLPQIKRRTPVILVFISSKGKIEATADLPACDYTYSEFISSR